jgi:arylsulfatase A-like enzyme
MGLKEGIVNSTMNRRAFLGVVGGTLAGTAVSTGASAAAQRRMNVLWISCEDISPHLGCYGVPEARTPNLDQLAAEGARFTNAYSVSGVCAPSRSCIITGMYPTSLGSCHMRCGNPVPNSVRLFPEYLRDAGYYCTNNRKTDYNISYPGAPNAWDESSGKAHWRNRPSKDQPFFAVFNFTATHESAIGRDPEKMPEVKERLGQDALHDPAQAQLPPYYPDTPVIRKHWAHYFDLITYMDAWAGDLLRQLEEDGLADDTVVVYWSDHGAGLPRAKRWIYDSGLHVPMIVRWPGRIEPNSVREDMVSFVDFAPTVLNVAGVPAPDHMQGKAFLPGADPAHAPHIFAARDRMDERFDIIRAVRGQRYQYIRNYEPYRPYDQYITYLEGWPVMQEMRRVQKDGALKPPEALFFRQRKPVEEFYDLSEDPHELSNLAESPEHQAKLAELRQAMDAWMTGIRDLGLVPESLLADWLPERSSSDLAGARPEYSPGSAKGAVFGRAMADWVKDLNQSDRLKRLMAIKSIGLIGTEAVPVLLEALSDPEPAVAYWAAVSLGHAGGASGDIADALTRTLRHDSVTVRLGAARGLCALGRPKDALPAALAAMDDPEPAARLYAVQVLEQVGLDQKGVREAMERALKDKNGYVVRIAKYVLSR